MIQKLCPPHSQRKKKKAFAEIVLIQKQAGKVWKEKEGKHILRFPGCTSFFRGNVWLADIMNHDNQDHEADIGGEGKEFSSTVVFFTISDINKVSHCSLTILSPIGSLAEYPN